MKANTLEPAATPAADGAPLVDGQIRWMVREPFRKQFLHAGAIPLSQWLASKCAEIVKQGPHRIVYRVETPQLKFHLKRNLVGGIKTWLREQLLPSKARQEFYKTLEVARRGIATVAPIAVGECRLGPCAGESYLITQSLEDTTQLNVFLQCVLPKVCGFRHTRIRQRLAVNLGRFIGSLHNAGVLHNDLHCGNILVHLDEDDEPWLHLIDLHTVRLSTPLGWRRSRRNLVILNRWLALHASRSDRMRFWRAYIACRTGGENRKALAGIWQGSWQTAGSILSAPRIRELERRTLVSNERFWRRREKRCFESNRHFSRISSGSFRGYCVTDLDPNLKASLLNKPDAPFGTANATILKDSRSGTVMEFTGVVGGKERTLIYKRFADKGGLGPVLGLLRPTPPLRSWLLGHSMCERGLPTARPLLMLHRYRFGLPREGYLLMEKVEADGDLHWWMERLSRLGEPHRRWLLRARLPQLARLIADLHARCLSHRDLKAANILVRALDDFKETRAPSGDRGQSVPCSNRFHFIDLVGVTRKRNVPFTLRVKNLARLHASFCLDHRLTRTDKLRFLRAYLRWGLYGKAGWKKWWKSIEAATLAKLEKNRRNNRPLA